MKDEYTLAFTKVVQQTVAETGFSIPDDIETYIIACYQVMLKSQISYLRKVLLNPTLS